MHKRRISKPLVSGVFEIRLRQFKRVEGTVSSLTLGTSVLPSHEDRDRVEAESGEERASQSLSLSHDECPTLSLAGLGRRD